MMQGCENDSLLPAMKAGEQLNQTKLLHSNVFSQKPPRYSEASLVRKLEELGIGRPSTYAPTIISTIQNRVYVEKAIVGRSTKLQCIKT